MAATATPRTETVAVVAALGTQGTSVIKALQSSPATSHWQIRALTSSPDSAAAQSLAAQPNITVVPCDVSSLPNLLAAFENCSLIFANTAFHAGTVFAHGQAAAEQRECEQGLNIVRAAAATRGLKHLVWSTLTDCSVTSGGKWEVPHFMSKQGANAYIVGGYEGYGGQKYDEEPGWGTLRGKSTLMAVGMYGSNFRNHAYRPVRKVSTYA